MASLLLGGIEGPPSSHGVPSFGSTVPGRTGVPVETLVLDSELKEVGWTDHRRRSHSAPSSVRRACVLREMYEDRPS